MAFFFYLLLVFLPLTSEVCSSRDYNAKYGCVFTPNVCVPPEDCNGITGHCQVSRHTTEMKYDEDNRKVLNVLEAARSYDYTDSESHDLNTGTGFFSDNDIDSHTAVQKPQKSSPENRGLPLNHFIYKLEKQHPNTNYKTRQLINKHLDEFQYALAQKGRRLADLTTDELKILVRYLASIIRNEQSRNIDNSTPNELAKQGSESQVKTKEVDLLAQRTSDDINSSPIQGISKSSEDHDASDGETIEVAEGQPGDGVEMEVVESTSLDATSKSMPQSQLQKDTLLIVIIVVGATVLLTVVVTITSCAYYTYTKKKQEDTKFIHSMVSRQPVGSEYQDLCRQHYANKKYEVGDESDSDVNFDEYSVASTRPIAKGAPSMEELTNSHQHSSVSSMSWSEEPATATLDVTTGHKVLDYMENHLNNKDRLVQEWHDLCTNKPDEFTVEAAKSLQNVSKNRIDAALPYDYNRVMLNVSENHVESDYINASKVIDSDPKRPLYIAAQGPLPSTVPDFWQMVWEHDCVAIVMLTALVEEGVNQCARYWPDEGSSRYHNFEINLVSEHIWCEHYLVRSLYLKHMVTGETRTVTQFHFLSWPKNGIPSTPKHLLELRRKVSKCSKAHHSPVLVHCSDGIGRTGTYILLDLVINRLLKRPLEIDIAATLEHIRDMRAGMVANKDQFEFSLTAVAEEVNAAMKTT